MTPRSRILLISNSTVFGGGYLDHVEDEIKHFLGNRKTVLFFPFALKDCDGYAAKARERLAVLGYTVTSAHAVQDKAKAVEDTDAVFIGGGNTFRLLKALQDLGFMESIRRRVGEGMPYIGSSAGSNVAAPTIRTTNDMPIVEPQSFDALGLVPFQINPHYLDPDPGSTHMGETREERIIQFLEENNTPVVGLREGAWLRIENRSVLLNGTTGARVFRRGQKPVEVEAGEISDLVATSDEASKLTG